MNSKVLSWKKTADVGTYHSFGERPDVVFQQSSFLVEFGEAGSAVVLDTLQTHLWTGEALQSQMTHCICSLSLILTMEALYRSHCPHLVWLLDCPNGRGRRDKVLKGCSDS